MSLNRSRSKTSLIRRSMSKDKTDKSEKSKKGHKKGSTQDLLADVLTSSTGSPNSKRKNSGESSSSSPKASPKVKRTGSGLFTRVRSNSSLTKYQETEIPNYKEDKAAILEALSAHKGERNHIAREIYTSELVYLQGITHLILAVKRPIGKLSIKSPFSEQEKEVLFANIETIQKAHVQFIKKLDIIFKEWSDTQIISKSFITFIEEIASEYVKYCKNHDTAHNLFEQLSQKSKIAHFQQKVLAHCDQQAIPALLILPVQRIPRYELLMRDLLKRTEKSHPDYAGIIEAQKCINKLATQINEAIRAHEKSKAFSDVQSKVAGMQDLQKNEARFLFEASLGVVTLDQGDLGSTTPSPTVISLKETLGKHARLVLFSNVLVLAKVEKKKKKKKNNPSDATGKRFFLHTLWVDDMPDSRDHLTILSPEFRIHLKANSVLDKNQTIENIRNAVKQWCNSRKNLVRVVDGVERRVFNHNFSDGRKYKGDWQDPCQPNGHGRIAFPSGDVYVGEHQNLVLTGKGKMTYFDGSIYEGEFTNNLPHGSGVLLYSDGASFYKGEFSEGLKHGSGEIFWASGNESYAGQFHRDVMQGKGVYVFSERSFYHGDFAANAWHGKGIYQGADGSRYEGEFESGSRNGQGKMLFANKDVYVGEWKQGKRHGKGKLVLAGDRGVYEGQWEDDCQQGEGVLVMNKINVRYEGEWLSSTKHGQGKETYGDGSYYQGSFSDGVREGKGVFVSSNGDRYEGNWHKNIRTGPGTFVDVDGTRYEGNWHKDKQNGEGKVTFPNGDTYEGQFRNGLFQGKGVFRRKRNNDESKAASSSSSGSGDGGAFMLIYEGQWENGKPHGEGTLSLSNLVYTGQWKNGVRHGEGSEKMQTRDTVRTGTWKDGVKHGSFVLQQKGISTDESWSEGFLLEKNFNEKDCTQLKFVSQLPICHFDQPINVSRNYTFGQ